MFSFWLWTPFSSAALLRDWSWIQTVSNWLSSDELSTLHFATLLWHCGPESRAALPLTGCMERHYQQRSPFTSYANMAPKYQGRTGSMVGCRAKSWRVLSNIFKINWMQT